MFSNLRRCSVVAVLAIMSTAMPPALHADSPSVPSARTTTHDVRLNANRQLTGLVVDSQGRPMDDVVVSVTRVDRTARPRQERTTPDGRFAVGDLQAGTYRLETSEGVCICRLWTSAAAPPAAAPSLLIVNDASVTRGQRPIRDLFHADPVLMATVVAAAIAIPIAVHKSRDDSSEGS